MPPPTARSKQDVGAASTFFGALVTMSAANADVPMSASAAIDAAIVVLILVFMTSPAQAVCLAPDTWRQERDANNVGAIVRGRHQKCRAQRIRNCCLLGRIRCLLKRIQDRVAAQSQLTIPADVASCLSRQGPFHRKKKGAPKGAPSEVVASRRLGGEFSGA